jgi:hypothetical protein
MDNETEPMTGPSGRVYQVPIIRTTFQPWAGTPVPNYGGKPVIDYGGRPLFAEFYSGIVQFVSQNARNGCQVYPLASGHITGRGVTPAILGGDEGNLAPKNAYV